MNTHMVRVQPVASQSEAALEYACKLTWMLTWILFGNPDANMLFIP